MCSSLYYLGLCKYTFAQGQTHFSERIPLVKRRKSVFCLAILAIVPLKSHYFIIFSGTVKTTITIFFNTTYLRILNTLFSVSRDSENNQFIFILS